MASQKSQNTIEEPENQKDDEYSAVTRKDKHWYQREFAYEGHPSPVYLKSGPREDRKCQDVICLVIFLLGFVYYVGSFIGFVENRQSPFALLNQPYDAQGRPCGVAPIEKYQYVYFTNPLQNVSETVCVSDCPRNTTSKLKCAPNSVITSCKPSDNLEIYPTMISEPLLCMPLNQTYRSAILSQVQSSAIVDGTENLRAAIPLILLSAVLSLLIGWASMSTLSLCAGVTVWVFIYFNMLLSALLGVIMFMKGTNTKSHTLKKAIRLIGTNPSSQDQSDSFYQTLLIVGAIVCWAISLFTLIFATFFAKRIRYMISALKVSSIFIQSNRSVYFLPIIFFILFISLASLWFLQLVWSLSKQILKSTSIPYHQINIREKDILLFVLQGILFFCFRGLTACMNDLTITTAACMWYYRKNQNEETKGFHSNVWEALKTVFRYHLGSVLIGAIVFTIFDRIASIFQSIYKTVVMNTYKEKNKIAYYSSVCFVYTFFCFSCCLRYITRTSLLWIAMTGQSFYESCKEATHLQQRNEKRFENISKLGSFFNNIAKIFISLQSSLICYIILLHAPSMQYSYSQSVIPLLGFIIVSYTTGSLFMDIYGYSSEALVLTSFIDEEVEKHHFGREDVYNCPQSIRPLINEIRSQRN